MRAECAAHPYVSKCTFRKAVTGLRSTELRDEMLMLKWKKKKGNVELKC